MINEDIAFRILVERLWASPVRIEFGLRPMQEEDRVYLAKSLKLDNEARVHPIGNWFIQSIPNGYRVSLRVQTRLARLGVDRVEPWLAQLVFALQELTQPDGVKALRAMTFTFGEPSKRMWNFQRRLRHELKTTHPQRYQDLAQDGEYLFLALLNSSDEMKDAPWVDLPRSSVAVWPCTAPQKWKPQQGEVPFHEWLPREVSKHLIPRCAPGSLTSAEVAKILQRETDAGLQSPWECLLRLEEGDPRFLAFTDRTPELRKVRFVLFLTGLDLRKEVDAGSVGSTWNGFFQATLVNLDSGKKVWSQEFESGLNGDSADQTKAALLKRLLAPILSAQWQASPASESPTWIQKIQAPPPAQLNLGAIRPGFDWSQVKQSTLGVWPLPTPLSMENAKETKITTQEAFRDPNSVARRLIRDYGSIANFHAECLDRWSIPMTLACAPGSLDGAACSQRFQGQAWQSSELLDSLRKGGPSAKACLEQLHQRLGSLRYLLVCESLSFKNEIRNLDLPFAITTARMKLVLLDLEDGTPTWEGTFTTERPRSESLLVTERALVERCIDLVTAR